METRWRFVLFSILVALAAVPLIMRAAWAYEYPLTSSSIREASLLASEQDNNQAETLKKYAHPLGAPKSGPHISLITAETPFLQIAEFAGLHPNFSSQDIVAQFLNKPLAFRAKIEIEFTPSYPAMIYSQGALHYRPEDFWQNYRYTLTQNDKTIEQQSAQAWPLTLYSDAGNGSSSETITGEQVSIECDPAKIVSAPLTVVVDTPDGQHVETTFDLTKMK
ncbi:MAG: hypothetical protein ACRD4M_07150 [Candidatus Acidiferrales bacterium]